MDRAYIEDGKVTGTGINGYTVEVKFFDVDKNRVGEKQVTVVGGKWEAEYPSTSLDEDFEITAQQFLTISNPSGVTEWILPPKAPTVNEIHVGENVHVEGKANPNYWLHQEYTHGDGTDTDTYSAREDGTFRSLNPINNTQVGYTVSVQQMKSEFAPEDRRSKPTIVTIKE